MASTRSILENVFGMLGIIFWSFQLLPQVIENYKKKSTEGLSYSMFFIWILAALGFGSYDVAEKLSIPIIVQPQIFGSLSALCFLQCLYYGKRTRWSLRNIVVFGTLLFVAMAGIQAGAIYATKYGEDNQVKGTTVAAGVIPIVLVVLGFMPQYADIYRDKSVVGVSMAFIAADAMGAVFSIISLCFRDTIDILATLTYVMVLVCDLTVFGFFLYYNKLNPSLSRVQNLGADSTSDYGTEKSTVFDPESTIVTIVEPSSEGCDVNKHDAGPEHDHHSLPQ
ncbi:hypothetical protein BGX26_004540 [Mortierella sp. AD094]|nr:hypothetical protein BGX26_004540 [Mortierella sp. AD094]